MNEIKDYVSKYIETKNKLKELEKKSEKYNKIIQDYMTKENTNSFDHEYENQKYNIKKSIVSRQSVSKKDMPIDVWEKYSKYSSYVMISLKKK